jgi:hypothetical protein
VSDDLLLGFRQEGTGHGEKIKDSMFKVTFMFHILIQSRSYKVI